MRGFAIGGVRWERNGKARRLGKGGSEYAAGEAFEDDLRARSARASEERQSKLGASEQARCEVSQNALRVVIYHHVVACSHLLSPA